MGMEPLQSKQYALYPFLRDSSEYIRSKELSLDDVITSDVYSSVRARAKKRVIIGLNHLVVDLEDPENPTPFSTEADYIDEILSYVIARVLVSCIKDKTLTRRYSPCRIENDAIEIVLPQAWLWR